MSGMRRIRAENPSPMTLEGTNSFVVGVSRPLVIDPGPLLAAHLERLLDALSENPPIAILLTHGHPDHSGAAEVLSELTGAPVHIGPGATRAPTGGRLEWLRPGERFVGDAGMVEALPTPGHTPEHFSFVWHREDGRREIFVGDHLMGVGDTTLVAPPEGELRSYLESLERLERVEAARLHPAHGPEIEDPAAALRRYREHRMRRIGQVRDELSRGAAGVGELVNRVYGDLRPELRGAAEGSIEAILRYLQGQEPLPKLLPPKRADE